MIESSLSSYVIGCQNTPAKGFRYCENHKDVAREFLNDEAPVAVVEAGSSLLIVRILNERILRQDSVYDVQCSNQHQFFSCC